MIFPFQPNRKNRRRPRNAILMTIMEQDGIDQQAANAQLERIEQMVQHWPSLHPVDAAEFMIVGAKRKGMTIEQWVTQIEQRLAEADTMIRMSESMGEEA